MVPSSVGAGALELFVRCHGRSIEARKMFLVSS
jgi:hypothetical protein